MNQTQRLDFTIQPPHGRATRADARFRATLTPKPLVIFIHGFKGFKEWGHFNLLADYFAQHNLVFVKLNLSHNGSTPDSEEPVDLEAFGRNNFSIELSDVKALIDFLFSAENPIPKTEVDLNRLYLIGHSRGGGLAILASAADQRIKATATWAAISDLANRWPPATLAQWQKDGVMYIENARTKQSMPLYYQLVEDFQANKSRLDIPAAATRMPQPLLLIHGTNDETLPVQMAYELKKNKPDALLEILAGANHTFGGSHPYLAPELPPDAKLAADKTIRFFQQFHQHQ
jgi:dienelactone hydrolase